MTALSSLPILVALAQSVGAKFNKTTGALLDYNGDKQITDADYKVKENVQLFKDAHAAGLKIHTWTFRDEPYRLAVDYNNDPTQEYLQFLRLGADGVFSDNCKTAVPARDLYLKQKQP